MRPSMFPTQLDPDLGTPTTSTRIVCIQPQFVVCPLMPTAKIPPVLRSSTGGEKEIAVDGTTVGDALRSLASQHPDTERQLFGDGGELNRYVNVYKNDEDVRVLDGLDTPLSDSDTLMILPAMAGG